MLAITASRLSSPDMWRRGKDEKTREISALDNWRARSASKESRETGWVPQGKETKGTKDMLGSWRVQKQAKGNVANVSGIYGGCMPPEFELQRMYKQLKIDNNRFTTWLVESVYPCIESLPPYITLSPKRAKGEPQPDRAVSEIEPNLTKFNRPSQIRHRREQHHRACTPNTHSPTE